jgi:anti-anti-sigma regulatory factor
MGMTLLAHHHVRSEQPMTIAHADLWVDLDEAHGTVYIGGQLDHRGCAHLGTAVLGCISRSPGVHIIDILHVEVLSSAAIQLIDRARHLVAAHGHTLQIVCRPGTPARAALAAAGLGPHLTAAVVSPPVPA